MKKKIIIIILILLLAIGLSFLYNYKKEKPTDSIKESEYKLITEKEDYVAKNDEGTIIAKNRITKVTITNEAKKEQATKIEKSINKILQEYWDRANDQADEMLESGFYDATIEDLNFGVVINANEYAKSDKNYIIEIMEVGHFGGSEWNAKYLYNYNPNNGELLSLKDISDNYDELQKIVIKNTKEYLNKEYKKEDLFLEDKTDEDLFDIIKTNGNWALTNEGLVVIFQKNDIAPSSTGIIEFTIDINNIKEYLNKDYK